MTSFEVEENFGHSEVESYLGNLILEVQMRRVFCSSVQHFSPGPAIAYRHILQLVFIEEDLSLDFIVFRGNHIVT